MELTGDQEQMKVTMGVVDGQFCGNLYVQFQYVPVIQAEMLYFRNGSYLVLCRVLIRNTCSSELASNKTFPAHPSPHHPTTPSSGVRPGSVGSDPQLDVPDQFFSTTHSRISAERSG